MLSETDAEYLTEQAQLLANQLNQVMTQIYEGKAWIALGYATIREYIYDRFGRSPSWFYDALHVENVKAKLEGAGVLCVPNTMSNRAALALEKLSDDMIIQAYETAAKAQKPVTEPVILAAVERIQQTMQTGAVELSDGTQVPVVEALADGVRGVLREQVNSQRDYIVANVEATVIERGSYEILVRVLIDDADPVKTGDMVRGSIWRELA